MIIAICGLGLIGGSFAKAIKANTSHTVYGFDKDGRATDAALKCGAIDRAITEEDFCKADLTLVCLFSRPTVDFILHTEFKESSVVADICGVKRFIVESVDDAMKARGIRYVGTHPMAGRECSGFSSSLPDLYKGASYIITETANTDESAVKELTDLALSIGFGEIVRTTPEDHDASIAFTSQLAHVVSNAYIKSPTLKRERGFSAGSFLDLTRVAKLDETMWAPLFMENRENLIFELDHISARIAEYNDALKNGDEDKLRELLRDGRILKEQSLK